MYLGLGLRLGSFFKSAEAQSLIPLQGLSLWLKADTGVTLSGSDVTAWEDQSGNNLNFNAITGYTYANMYPTFVASGINNKPSIDFLNSLMISPNTNLGSSGYTIFVVGYSRGNGETDGNGGDLQTYINYSDLANLQFDSWALGAYAGTNTDFNFNAWASADDGTNYSSVLYPNDVNNPRIITALQGGDEISIYINGLFYDTVGCEFLPQALNKPIGIGNRSIIDEGIEPGSRENLDARISEVIIYNQRISPTERQQVEAYLNTKYALY